MSNKISEVFDVEPVKTTQVAEVNIAQTKVQDDADFARANMRSLISTAQTALANALEVAVQSESPRAYEVLATMLNTAADLNTKLIDVHQKEKRMTDEGSKQTPTTQNITNNVVFSGTTAELNDMIAKRMLNNETSSN